MWCQPGSTSIVRSQGGVEHWSVEVCEAPVAAGAGTEYAHMPRKAPNLPETGPEGSAFR